MAEAELRFGADATQILTEYQKIAAAEKMWRVEVAQTTRAVQQREDTMNKSLRQLQEQQQKTATEGTLSIGKMTEAWGVQGKVIEEVIKASERALQQLNAAGEKHKGNSQGLGRLAELATNDADMKRMVDETYKLRGKGVTETVDEAARLQFQFESLKIDKEGRERIAGLKKFGVVSEAEDVAKSVTVMQRAMGEDKAGTFTQLLSKGIAAAAPSPTQFQGLMINAGLAAPGAKAVGMSSEDLLAGMGVLTKTMGTPESAREGMDAITKAMAKRRGEDGKDRTLGEFVKDVQGHHMTAAQEIEFFGRAEGRKAYQLLAGNLGNFEQLRGEVYGSTNDDLAAQKTGIAARNPTVAAGVAKRVAEGELEESMRPKAEREALYQARVAKNKDGTLAGNLTDSVNTFVHDWGGADWAAQDWGGNTRDRQLGEIAKSAGTPQLGRKQVAPQRDYKMHGMVIPQVPEDSDPDVVRIKGRMAEIEQQITTHEGGLRQKYSHGTPSDERHIRRDKEEQRLIAALKGVELELKNVEARRRINMGKELGAAQPPRSN